MLIKGTSLVSSRLESEIDIEEEGLEVVDKEVVAQLSKGTLRREHANSKISSRLSALTFLKVHTKRNRLWTSVRILTASLRRRNVD